MRSTKLLFILLFGLLTFLAFNRHSQSGYFNYHSEIWADKAGYQVYLPALFIYDFKADAFPENIADKTGNGFTLVPHSNKMITKYPYGVALLQSPFFIGAHQLAPVLGQPNNGYSPIYHWAINIAAAFYATWGLYMLYLLLRYSYSRFTSRMALGLVLLASPLYFYTITDGGMSHVYSFFMYTLLLYSLHSFRAFHKHLSAFKYILLGAIMGVLLSIRLTNAMLIMVSPLLFATDWKMVSKNLKSIINPTSVLTFMIVICVFALPQMWYNKYAFGEFFRLGYPNEGFNWWAPKTLFTWFAPQNGLFLYGAIYLFIIWSMVQQWKTNKFYVWFFGYFLLISYVFSSWWDWTYGCSFGQRNFVEYLPIFVFPLADYIEHRIYRSSASKLLFYAVVLLLIGTNLQLVYAYDQCYYGSGIWDWSFYTGLLFNAW